MYKATSLSAGVLMLSMKSAVGFDLWFANTFTTSPNTAGMYTLKNATTNADWKRYTFDYLEIIMGEFSSWFHIHFSPFY